MYHLSNELQEHLRVIDPHMVLKEEMEIFGVKMNSMIRLRKETGLQSKPKGRPKDRDYNFDGITYPEEVQNSIDRIREIRANEIRVLEERKKNDKR